jgi:DNA-binding CsgD family transcriptional regulator
VPITLLTEKFDAMQQAKSEKELQFEMERFAREMGFELFTYALRIAAPSLTPQEFLLSGYPAAWVERYLKRGYFAVDPVVLHCQKSALPVLWDESMNDGSAAEYWEEARAFGLRTGVSFAVHEQPGMVGIFSLARDQRLKLEGAELDALIGRAQVFASLLHHAVVRVHLPRLIPEASAPLTARERECLKWAADGKTAWEIGQILGITERTAIFHINNVIHKLGALNKTQAIVRAMALKMIY